MKYLLRINLGNIVFAIITLLWWSEFIIFNPSRKEAEEGRESFYQILAAILSSIFLAFLLSYFKVGNFNSGLLIGVRVISLIIYGMGLLIRYWSLIVLGKHFTRGISVEPEQELVKDGLYSYLCHPLYLGLFLLTIGAVSFMGNWIGIIFAIIVMFIALRNRILNEEKHLTETLGVRYERWKDDKDRFLPFIY